MSYREWLGKLSISPKALGRYQRIANLIKLFSGYSPLPLHIDLVLTLKCNFACKMCNLRQQENLNFFSPFRKPELSPREWMDVIRDIRDSFYLRPNLNLLGGEPSIYDGYLDVAAFAKQQGFRCSYTTNGSFLTRDVADIVSAAVDVIAVSIDGPQEIHDYIRRAGAYDRAVMGIHAINEHKKKHGKRAPQVFLACTITGHNHEHLADLVDVARYLDIHYIIFLHLQFPDREIGLHGINVGRLTEEIGCVRRKARDSNISVSFSPNLSKGQIATYYLQSSDQLDGSCISPWIRIAVMPNGSIVPCQDHVMGKVRDKMSLGSVWNSKQMRSFRKKLAEAGVFADCGRCCHRQY
jgi:radical SAM protein with 4Fe4S-binding SPASM domain